MRSNLSNAAAGPSHETPCVRNGHRIQESHPPSVTHPPTSCIRAAGVLRYNRETDYIGLNVPTLLPELPPLPEFAVKCEFCGEKARPSLSLTWLQGPETAPYYCCAQHQQLCEMLVKERDLCRRKRDLTAAKKEFPRHIPIRHKAQSVVKINKGYSIQAATESFASDSSVLRFRLSCTPGKGSKTVCSSGVQERRLKTEQEEPVCCDHKPLRFGLCHHQEDGAGFLLKYYSSGKKCLTLFCDGSGQVFYPSGHLALMVVTEENGRACIVYDEGNAPNPGMRAVFQSDGSAACYHSNGNIWLSLNTSGGQCLDEAGARVRRWRWDGVLHPVFLSLNKAVGVRVLGRHQVFVSFLAQGQQAKFSVGTCCAQGESDTGGPASGPLANQEELEALEARNRTCLAIQKLQRSLMANCKPQLPKTT